ncbi:chitin disaccharide deacetylase [Enterococcus asini]|uniref:chitin disaccharide deacetylase n=1 Tax=Enterococcus asini TaxID=57732 RepID=UPI00289151DE|nr:chitin disaccharide deacetylase [Enterococcus asini]MDT2757468.1 chitin disaccharide deacetylase [Enterococcus asini]
MSLLIVNADDFGYSAGINYGIIEAHRKGILTSTTLMANMPGFDHAVQLSKEYTELGIGIHLVLTCDKPLLKNHQTIVDDRGNFQKLKFYEKDFSIDLEEVRMEWEAQIQKVLEAGIDPTHLDSHHHVNTLPGINQVFIDLAEKYDLPVRGNFEVPDYLKTCDRFFTSFDGIGSDKEIWKPMIWNNLISDCQTYGVVEVMCHPGYVDAELMDRSSFTKGRAYICRELQREIYPIMLAENGVKLGTYKELSVLQSSY